MASKLKLLNANGKTLTIENGDTSNSDMNVRYFKTVSDLTTATGINGDTAVLTDVDRGGTFIWSSTGTVNGITVLASPNGVWVKKKKDALISESSTATDYANFRVDRNANHIGGTVGFVNSAIRVNHSVSTDVTNFEWGITSVMNNSSTTGENVAVYGQGNKLGAGPTWAGVFEARDNSGLSATSGLVGIEVDVFAAGNDTNSNRVGIDIVIGKNNPASAAATIEYGIRLGTINGDPSQGTLGNGIRFNQTINYPLAIYSTGFNGIHFGTGSSYINGIDLSAGTFTGAAIKLNRGQAISFENTNTIKMSMDSTLNVIKLNNGATEAVGLGTGGSIRILGNQILGARSTGWAQMTGTSNRNTVYDTSTITLPQLAERMNSVLNMLANHGIIGV